MNDEIRMTNTDAVPAVRTMRHSSMVIRPGTRVLCGCVILVSSFVIAIHADSLEGFKTSNHSDDQINQLVIDDVRVVIDAASNFDSTKPTTLIIYALPNGNSIEQTIGCSEQQGVEWHYFIQQIGAQTRALRAADTTRN